MSDFRDYGGIILGCVAIGGYLAFGGMGQLTAGQQTRSQLAAERQQNSALLAQQRVEQERLIGLAEIAEERYQNGCLLVFASDEMGNVTNDYASILQGHPVFDEATNSPLPAGTVVCDANGATAIIDSELKADKLAITHNRQVIDPFVANYWKQGEYLGQTQE